MKRFRRFFLLALPLLATSCTKNENPEPMAEYTVIYYRNSSLGLDFHHKNLLEELVSVGSTERVNVVAEYKYSKFYQNEPDCDGTRRVVIEKDNIRLVEKMDATTPMQDPEHIAGFIRWAKENYPAKKYILVTSGHGNGWTVEDDSPKGRAINPDDNIEGTPYISMADLSEGIRRSGTRFEMIFFHNCLMLTAEVMGEMQPYTRYLLGSTHEIWLPGCSFSYFLRQLNKPIGLPEAMKPFISQTIYNWKGNMALKADVDLQLLDLDKLDAVFAPMAGIVERLKSLISGQYESECSTAHNSTYRLDSGWPLYDFGNYVNQVLKWTRYDVKLQILYSQFDEAMRDMVVYKEESNDQGVNVSLGINIVNKTRYNGEYLTGAHPYNTLRFHQSTLWGEYMALIRDYDNP